MTINITDIKWEDPYCKLPTELTTTSIDADNSLDEITTILSEWIADTYAEHNGFCWKFADSDE